MTTLFICNIVAVINYQQAWLERIKHHFTECIVQIVLNVINSRTSAKIATIFKRSPVDTSHYEVGSSINKTAATLMKTFGPHHLFPSRYTGYKRLSLWSTVNVYNSTMKKTCMYSSSTYTSSGLFDSPASHAPVHRVLRPEIHFSGAPITPSLRSSFQRVQDWFTTLTQTPCWWFQPPYLHDC